MEVVMMLTDYGKMVFSSHTGWDELERIHPSVVRLYLLLVLPMSLVPPAMIGYAGIRYGSEYFATATIETWVASAAVFLMAELVTVPLMAWAMVSIASTRNISTNFHDTFAVAAFAAVPLWLSALALFVPNPLFVIGVVLIGLIVSVSLIYHGIAGLLHMHEEVEVASITYTTIGLGVVTWALLIALIFLPLLWK
jgi:hypothetical protein